MKLPEQSDLKHDTNLLTTPVKVTAHPNAEITDQSNGSTLLLWGNCDASINKSTLISCLKASKMLSCFCGVRSVWCQRLRLLPKPVTSSSTWEISWHTWQPRDNLPTHHYLCLVIWSTLCLLETRFVLGNSSHTYLFCLGILPGEE